MAQRFFEDIAAKPCIFSPVLNVAMTCRDLELRRLGVIKRSLPATRWLAVMRRPGILSRIRVLLKAWAGKRNIPVVEAPQGRRDDFVDPYFNRTKPDEVVVILKAREPARIMPAVGDGKTNRWHLQIANRWVVQYNFYIDDQRWGRMFVRICPYLPFSARVCLNQHHWLASRMREKGIDFKQCGNAFTRCSAPERLQQLADSLDPRELLTCGQKWLAQLTPFFTAKEREEAGCQHRLFFAQIEFCDNLVARQSG